MVRWPHSARPAASAFLANTVASELSWAPVARGPQRRASRTPRPNTNHEDDGPAARQGGDHSTAEDGASGCARRWGRMSAHQMVCHLGDSFRHRDAAESGQPRDRPPSIDAREVDRLVRSTPWPAGVPTRPEMDQEFGRHPTRGLRGGSRRTRGPARDRHDTGHNYDWPAHPIFGRMSEAAWLRWAYLHMDHHLRQFGL